VVEPHLVSLNLEIKLIGLGIQTLGFVPDLFPHTLLLDIELQLLLAEVGWSLLGQS
jgi:hypothetical protein